MPLSDRVAIVAGADGGLGRVVSRELAAAGVRLALIGRHQEHLDATGLALGVPADRWVGLTANLLDRAETERMVATVVERFGRLDILAHLIGGYTGGTAVADLADADMTGMLGQHLWTTLNATRAVTPHLTAAGWGRIVAVSTPVAAEPPPKMAPYAVGKAAEEALLGTLAREVAGSGVTVNVIRVRKIDIDHARDAIDAPKGAASWTSPEEIAATILYLCSDAAGMVNGARIPVHGGA